MEPVNNTILVGHVMDQLRQLPEKSVQTVITSPPYWGLRVYGIEPQIWGSYTPCPHDFAEREVMAVGGSKGNWQQADNGTSHKSAGKTVVYGGLSFKGLPLDRWQEVAIVVSGWGKVNAAVAATL